MSGALRFSRKRNSSTNLVRLVYPCSPRDEQAAVYPGENATLWEAVTTISKVLGGPKHCERGEGWKRPANSEVQLHKCRLRCQPAVRQQCFSESNLYSIPDKPRQQYQTHTLEKPKKPCTANPTWRNNFELSWNINVATSSPLLSPCSLMMWLMDAWSASPFTSHCTPCTAGTPAVPREIHMLLYLPACPPALLFSYLSALKCSSDISSFSKTCNSSKRV